MISCTEDVIALRQSQLFCLPYLQKGSRYCKTIALQGDGFVILWKGRNIKWPCSIRQFNEPLQNTAWKDTKELNHQPSDTKIALLYEMSSLYCTGVSVSQMLSGSLTTDATYLNIVLSKNGLDQRFLFGFMCITCGALVNVHVPFFLLKRVTTAPLSQNTMQLHGIKHHVKKKQPIHIFT